MSIAEKLDSLTEYEWDVSGEIFHAIAMSPTPLSTIEVWHAVYQETRCSYGQVRKILRAISEESGSELKVKKQVGGFGRRDYYFDDAFKAQII